MQKPVKHYNLTKLSLNLLELILIKLSTKLSKIHFLIMNWIKPEKFPENRKICAPVEGSRFSDDRKLLQNFRPQVGFSLTRPAHLWVELHELLEELLERVFPIFVRIIFQISLGYLV